MTTTCLLRTSRRWGPSPANHHLFKPAAIAPAYDTAAIRRHSHHVAHDHARESRDPAVEDLLKRLQKLSSGPLCDADKGHYLTASTSDDPDVRAYAPIRMMCTNTMKLRSRPSSDDAKRAKMIGIARTVQLTRPNDFLGVLRALGNVHAGDVLVVNTSGSTRAVAGGLFTTEAARRGCGGIVVDGPIRDVDDLACPTYSTMVTPYAGTVQNPGEGIDTAPILCGGVTVNPGDILFGDSDGVLVGSAETFTAILDDAENVVAVEQQLMRGMEMGIPLHKMTNFDEHIQLRKEGKESKIEFKDLHTVKFDAMDPIHYD